MDQYMWHIVGLWICGRITWPRLQRALRERPLLVVGRKRAYVVGAGGHRQSFCASLFGVAQ